MKFFLLFFLSFLCFYATWAQNGLPQNAGARGGAMANASVTFSDIQSIFSNQAGLGYLEEISFSIYGERRFINADGINAFQFGFAYPDQRIGTFGLSVNYFGFSLYNEQKIGLSYSRKLFKRMSIGAQFNYLGTRFNDGIYGSAHNFTFEAGILVKVSKQFNIGAHVFSPARIELSNGDVIPSLFKLGMSYMQSDKLMINAELEKDLENPFNAKFGIEYHPLDALFIRAGFSSAPLNASFGFGVLVKGLKLDVFSAYHIQLGFTPGVSVSYMLPSNRANSKTRQ